MKISPNLLNKAKRSLPLTVLMLSVLAVGAEISVIKSDIQQSEDNAIKRGSLDKDSIRKMEAFVKWEMQQSNRDDGVVGYYNKFANAFKAGKTVDQIVNETLDKKEQDSLQLNKKLIQAEFEKVREEINK